MRKALLFVGGVGIGAATMFALDPRSGKRRRARIAEMSRHMAREAQQVAVRAGRDLAHRSQGALTGVRARVRPAPVSNDKLAQRVRARLGRVCTHPAAIKVIAHDGIVELDGLALAHEVPRLLKALAGVRGVRRVVDRLDVRESAGQEPALQGMGRLPATGGGLRRWLARAFRGSLRAHGVHVQKIINVGAPVGEVFSLFSDLESFPRFMTHVKAVTRSDDRRFHWVVDGPGGLTVTWTAEVTELVPDDLIAWRTVERASVAHTGIVRFAPNDRGGTRVEIHLAYSPPAGAVGHGIAALLGADPKKQLDDDMLRFKSLVEQGKATGREQTVTRQELANRAFSPQKA